MDFTADDFGGVMDERELRARASGGNAGKAPGGGLFGDMDAMALTSPESIAEMLRTDPHQIAATIMRAGGRDGTIGVASRVSEAADGVPTVTMMGGLMLALAAIAARLVDGLVERGVPSDRAEQFIAVFMQMSFAGIVTHSIREEVRQGAREAMAAEQAGRAA